MTAANVPAQSPDTPDYGPFTESILADLAALPPAARWELIGEVRDRFGPGLRVAWLPVLGSVVIPLFLLAVYQLCLTALPGFERGLYLGVVASFVWDALCETVGTISLQSEIWRVRRAEARRGGDA
jgi:hypothetical protein